MPPAFSETITVEVHEFEPIPTTFHEASYPLPKLRRAGTAKSQEIEVVVLQNDYLIAKFAPSLGGRLLALIHRESGTNVLPQSPQPVEGLRGDTYEWGLEFVIGSECRNSLGPVDHQLIEADDYDGVVFSDTEPGAGISWHVFWTLSSMEARLQFEVRAVNRFLESNPYDCGFVAPSSFVAHGSVLWNRETSVALAVGSDPGVLMGDGNGVLRGQTLMAPIQTDTFSGWIAPIVGFDGPPHLGQSVAFEVVEDRLRVIGVSESSAGKVVALVGDSQPLEAPITLPPGSPRTLTLPEGTTDFRVIIEGTEQIGNAPHENALDVDPEPFAYSLYPILHSGDTYSLNRVARAASARAGTEAARAIMALRSGDQVGALDATEAALLFAGDHPVLWWLRAMANRMSGQVEDRPELLNAHYLAPLEPLLRAEAFLSLEQAQAKDPHPLVAPLADNPEAMVEVACWLTLCGNHVDLFRWVDECLRHREVTRLRILLAWAYLQVGQEFEALSHVSRIHDQRPPYLWQPVEHHALRGLLEKWPDNKNLQPIAEQSGLAT